MIINFTKVGAWGAVAPRVEKGTARVLEVEPSDGPHDGSRLGQRKSRIAVIYARSASSPDGGSCERQVRECELYAQREGLTILRRISEEGVSGMQPSPGLVAVASALSLNLVDVVLVADIGRLGRSCALVGEFCDAAKAAGAAVVALGEQLESTKPAARTAKKHYVSRVVRRGGRGRR